VFFTVRHFKPSLIFVIGPEREFLCLVLASDKLLCLTLRHLQPNLILESKARADSGGAYNLWGFL
jgi:hypothetical protein